MRELETEALFVCNMNALNTEHRARHAILARRLLDSMQELRELPNGYALRLSDDLSVIIGAAEFITLERLCCPFFNFELRVEANDGITELRLTGDEGIKDFILDEFGLREE